jgi:hypothetical protein
MPSVARLRVLGAAMALGLASLAGTAGAAPAKPAKAKAKAKAAAVPAKGKGKTAAAGRKSAKGTTTATAGRKGAAVQASAGGGGDWLLGRPANVVPNQHGKVVVFPFRDDDGNHVSRQVGHLLEARGLEVVTGVRKVDTVEQYRDVATHLNLVAYVDGDVRGSDAKTRATIRLRSGYSGRNVSQATFTESRPNLSRELSDKLWSKVGPAMARVCKDADKPRKKSRALQINAGTPIETVPRVADDVN